MSTGFIVYFLDKDTAQHMAIPGGEPPEELHITVAFLPELTSEQYERVQELLLGLTEVYAPMSARVNGIGRFFINRGDDSQDVLMLMPDVIGLAEMRIRLLDALDKEGIKYSTDHGYQPHITLLYLDDGETVELGGGEDMEFSLNNLTLIYRENSEFRGENEDEDAIRIDYPHIGERHFMKVKTKKAGARNNRMDSRNIQDIHDMSCKLGAYCDKGNMMDEEEDKSIKNMLWSEMDYGQRMEIIRQSYFDMIGLDKEDEYYYDIYIPKIYDDYFLVEKYGDESVFKYFYQVVNDSDVAIDNTPVAGSLQFIPNEMEDSTPQNPFKTEPLTADQARKSIKLGLTKDVPGANNLKTLGINDTEWRVGNYMVLWGGRDLTNERFIPQQTDNPLSMFESEYTKTDTVIEDWEHGLWPDGIGPTVDEPLGKVLWKTTAKADDIGVFVERVLNRQNKYLEALRELEEEGLITLGSSSEAIPSLVEKSKDGEIKRWGIKRDAITVTPAEPRMLDFNKIASGKNISEDEEIITFLKSIYENNTQEELEESSSDALLRLRLKRKTLQFEE